MTSVEEDLHPRIKSLEIAGKFVWWFGGLVVLLTAWSVTVKMKLEDVAERMEKNEGITRKLELDAPAKEAHFQILEAKLNHIETTVNKIDKKLDK